MASCLLRTTDGDRQLNRRTATRKEGIQEATPEVPRPAAVALSVLRPESDLV